MTNYEWLIQTVEELKNDPDLPWEMFPCFKWPFGQRGGAFKGKWRPAYGAVDVNGKWRGAHREAWIIANGPIPDGLGVLHRCDVPSCIRLRHLFLGTPSDNAVDCSMKDRTTYGERNSQAKLTEVHVREASVRLTSGESQRSIARSFNVSYQAIWRIAHSHTWQRSTNSMQEEHSS